MGRWWRHQVQGETWKGRGAEAWTKMEPGGVVTDRKRGVRGSLGSLKHFLQGLPRSLSSLPSQKCLKILVTLSATHDTLTTSLSWERPEYKPSSAWWHWLWPWSNDFRSLNLRFLVRFNGKEKNMQWLFLVDTNTFSDTIAWLSCKPHNDPLVPICSETPKSDRLRCKSQLLIY